MHRTPERARAKAAGLTRYFTGRPCKHGHLAERLTSCAKCADCLKIAMKRKRRTPGTVQHASRKAYRKRQKSIGGSQRANYLRSNKRWLTSDSPAAHAKRLGKTLRSRLYRALRAQNPGARAGLAARDLGCTLIELREYLVSLLPAGLSWEDRGNTWELDHKRPLSEFDLTDPDQLREACHYTNLQPLPVAEHRAKTAAENAARNTG